LRRLVEQETKSCWFADTPAGRAVRHLISKVSGTDMTVLIEGESGTGKGVTARLIHNASRRAEGPFVHANCAAIPETLVENGLFGHAKGAFTGASAVQEGLVAAASGGTLFLDEVGELPLPMQAKLLHVIEEKTIRPLGSTRDRAVDVRIISSTSRVRSVPGAGWLFDMTPNLIMLSSRSACRGAAWPSPRGRRYRRPGFRRAPAPPPP
jgi:two-component system response regulator AtoC